MGCSDVAVDVRDLDQVFTNIRKDVPKSTHFHENLFSARPYTSLSTINPPDGTDFFRFADSSQGVQLTAHYAFESTEHLGS
jgi:hypothetical protein